MATSDAPRVHVIVHLDQQSAVSFAAGDVWPRSGLVQDPGDLETWAEELTRRLHADGYLGYRDGRDRITVVTLGSIRRVDFSTEPWA